VGNQVVADFSESLQTLKRALESKKPQIQQGVLSWPSRNLPLYSWRQPGKTPYVVFLGEYWLKQTPPSVAINIFEPFMQHFPALNTLARATEEELVSFLSSFQLQSYARHLKMVAETLMKAGRGSMPRDSITLGKASGLAHYSIMAIMSFGYNFPIAVIDANVYRLLSRVFYNALPPQPVQGLIHALGESLLPQNNAQYYNSGLLDISETVCRQAKPLCSQCPLENSCDYVHAGLVNSH
jgi:A/G-specific adenine glycosylase